VCIGGALWRAGGGVGPDRGTSNAGCGGLGALALATFFFAGALRGGFAFFTGFFAAGRFAATFFFTTFFATCFTALRAAGFAFFVFFFAATGSPPQVARPTTALP
jgi:hypothetical protein